MSTLHLVASAAADPVQAAGILRTIRNAVLVFLLIVFLAGAVVGFLIARLIYRRGGSGTSGSGGFGTSGMNGSGFDSPAARAGQRRRRPMG